jgi:DNA-binding transcriptional regulator YiaG
MKKTIRGYGGLDYLVIRGVPFKKTKHGNIISAATLAELEKAIVAKLVIEQVPLRGAEVRFIRKALGYSMSKLGAALQLTSTSILKWEHDPSKRLSAINEVAVRALVAEILEIEIEGTFSALVGKSKTPEEIEMKAAS